jgi:hypothetical protein
MHYVFAIATQFQKSRLNKLELKSSLNEHKEGFKNYNALNQGNFSSGMVLIANTKVKRNQLIFLPRNWHQL